jgi:hypothetical protein
MNRSTAFDHALIRQEIVGLEERIAMIRPFALSESMLPAAMPARGTLAKVDRFLGLSRRKWLHRTRTFLCWLNGADQVDVPLDQVYRRFVHLRLQANASLAHLNLFAQAISQRSEFATGVLLRGLDDLAHEALHLERVQMVVPDFLCYLDGGMGAAIRRVNTRLPGGAKSPIALIRIPRERMVGIGLAGSLVHEVGHQGAATLNLVPILQDAIDRRNSENAFSEDSHLLWKAWRMWIPEIVADLWAVARLGVTATLGLIEALALPPSLVFQTNEGDPHPTPWIRVILGATLGEGLFPDPQWQRVIATWEARYPFDRYAARMDRKSQLFLLALRAQIPFFAKWLVAQPIESAGGITLGQVLVDEELQTFRLRAELERWQREHLLPDHLRLRKMLALVGYARINAIRLPVSEGRIVSWILTQLALRRSRPEHDAKHASMIHCFQ